MTLAGDAALRPPDPEAWPRPWAPIVLTRTHGLTEAVRALLAVVVTVELVLTAAWWWLIEAYRDSPVDYAVGFTHADVVVGLLVVLQFLVLVPTGICAIVLTYRLRRNADRMSSAKHRLGRPWAIAGWLVPVVSLWFPYWIASDTYRASDPDARPGEPAPTGRPPRYLLVWWLAWVLHNSMAFGLWPANGPGDPLAVAVPQTVAVIAAAVAAWYFARLLRETQERQLLRAGRIATLHPGWVRWR